MKNVILLGVSQRERLGSVSASLKWFRSCRSHAFSRNLAQGRDSGYCDLRTNVGRSSPIEFELPDNIFGVNISFDSADSFATYFTCPPPAFRTTHGSPTPLRAIRSACSRLGALSLRRGIYPTAFHRAWEADALDQ